MGIGRVKGYGSSFVMEYPEGVEGYTLVAIDSETGDSLGMPMPGGKDKEKWIAYAEEAVVALALDGVEASCLVVEVPSLRVVHRADGVPCGRQN